MDRTANTWEYLPLSDVTPNAATVSLDEGAPTFTVPIQSPEVHCILAEALRLYRHPSQAWAVEQPLVPIGYDEQGTPYIKVSELAADLDAHEASGCHCWLFEHLQG